MPLAAAVVAITLGWSDGVLLDGRCGEREWRAAASTELGEGARLLAMEDRERVYLCVTASRDSLTSLDLYLTGPSEPEPIDLHISAQVAERRRIEGRWPEFDWGNHRGWYGTPIPFRGLDAHAEGGPRVRFGEGSHREIALEKRRFGNHGLRIRLDVRALGPRRDRAVVFPAGSTDTDTSGWAVLRSGARRRR